jgi:hypothetical protein
MQVEKLYLPEAGRLSTRIFAIYTIADATLKIVQADCPVRCSMNVSTANALRMTFAVVSNPAVAALAKILNQSPALQAHMPLAPDHDVVVEGDAEFAGGLRHLAGHGDVVG